MVAALAFPVTDQPAACQVDPHDSSAPHSGPTTQLIARSAPMREILDLVRRIACTDSPVLIQGETGVGKRVMAREIHRLSRRAAEPLVHVGCAVLREAELDDKLFLSGEPGNGASLRNRGSSGLLESSRRGTLFLDDVSQLPLWAQVKLHDWLQQGKRSSGNGRASASLEPRVISATACDLAAAVASGAFDAGLYYCLNVVEICIPPLRCRPEDTRALGEDFLAAANAMRHAAEDATPRQFSEEAWQLLLSHDWPGNAMQLASVVARAVMLADSPEIGREQVEACLGETTHRPAGDTISIPLAGGLKQMELAIINEVLDRCRGNKAAAARSLRLHRRTLYRLLGQ